MERSGEAATGTQRKRLMVGRLANAAIVGWLVIAGAILAQFADAALPASYLVRPLVVAVPLAIVIGGASLVAGQYAPPIAAGFALVLSITAPLIEAPAAALTLAGILIAGRLLVMRRRLSIDIQRLLLLLTTMFFGLGVVRAAPLLDVQMPGREVEVSGPPMFLILLDGYPRIDTLADLGIDNDAFVHRLERRGFDHYPDAHSLHGWTHKTLLAMLTDERPEDGPSSIAEKRAIRLKLVVPPGFAVIDPPVGHVTLNGGMHLGPGGINDFEAYLLGTSAAGVIVPRWAGTLIVNGLRDRLDGALTTLETTDAQHVFMHLLAPHHPFLYDQSGRPTGPPECWPACAVFDSTIENLQVSREQWARGMAGQLAALNARLLQSVDRLLASHPDAVIVLFSDHGGRYSYGDPEEWHRSFLAARTPGFPGLFLQAPRPDAVIRTLLAYYGDE